MSGNLALVPPSPDRPLEKLLTPLQAAEVLGVNLDYIKNHSTRLKPLIPHVKLGGGRNGMRRYKPSQLQLFIDQNTTVPRRVPSQA